MTKHSDTMPANYFSVSGETIKETLQGYFPEQCAGVNPCPKVRDLLDVAVAAVIEGYASYEAVRGRVNEASQDFYSCHFSDECHQGQIVPVVARSM